MRADATLEADTSTKPDDEHKDEGKKKQGPLAMLRIPPEKANTGNFKSVPREYV